MAELSLSPLNFRGLLASQHLVGEPVTDQPPHKKRREGAGEAEPCWRCCACEFTYELRRDAEECCADEEDDAPRNRAGHHEDAPTPCPVCSMPAYSFRDAADCCLWKDIDAARRWRMADAVEAGGSWAEQLGLVGAHP
jgi:hypothetical protein